MKIKTKGGLPQTDSFAVLLVQGLESNDPDILNVSVIRAPRDAQVILLRLVKWLLVHTRLGD